MIGQVRAALTTISTASQSASGILSQTSTNSSFFCPNINSTNFDSRLGRNLLQLSHLLSVEYVALQNLITNNMTEIEDILQTIEDAADLMEFSFDRAESVMWLVPGLLLAVSIATALATFGVILAWKHESGVRLQRCMSYGLLPALTALCILCWILGIATVVTTTLSADFCLSGTKSGSPDITVENMLLTHGDLPNTTKHQFIGRYTSVSLTSIFWLSGLGKFVLTHGFFMSLQGCKGIEPALLIVSLERESQDKVDEIWAQISSVDSFGRSALSEDCGGAGLDELLSASRNIAKLLTKVRRALDSASDSLVCERIDPLYIETVHGSICTDFAEASGWGAVTFCLLGITMMTLITLRASWRVKIDEDRIYHDESEVAENMVVDEHEEYLRYISKYRHEWQEYNGFGSTSMRQSTSFSASEGEDDDQNFEMQSGSESVTSGLTNPQRQRRLNEDETSIESGEISFPSLDVPPTDDSSADQSRIVPMPPPILTDRRRKVECQATQNQEVMLCPKSTSREPNPPSLSELNEEEEKTEVDSETVPVGDDIDGASIHTGESTDFSSMGKNAGMNAGLYWKNQMGLGIEVVSVSSHADSLVVSPNTSDGGQASFDLTKTPSPKKAISSFALLRDKVPMSRPNSLAQTLYARKSSDERDVEAIELQRDPIKDPYSLKSVCMDPLPSRKVSAKKSTESSATTRRNLEIPKPRTSERSKSLQIQTENLETPSPVSKSPSMTSMISDAVLFRWDRSEASVTSPLARQIDAILGSIAGSVSFRDERAVTGGPKNDADPQRNYPKVEDGKPGTPTRDGRKLRHLLQKFDPKKLPAAADDLQTI
jgi:hypothetical protein